MGETSGLSTGQTAWDPTRWAYADPPYLGKAYLYRGHPDYAGEVDHGELVSRLQRYDGWALSCSASSLPAVLRLCPPDVRVAAWCRGSWPHATARAPMSSWEPVIVRGGRPALDGEPVPDDALVCGVRARQTDPDRVVGAKPAAFIAWLFGLLGARPGDTFDDLYPGSGGVARMWSAYESGACSGATSKQPNEHPPRKSVSAVCPQRSGRVG